MTRSAAEIKFASELKCLGYEFECNINDLPGRPDIVLRNRKIVIFYHGCFWHSHHCQGRIKSFEWQQNLEEIKTRDWKNLVKLKELGYHSLIIWDCDWKNNKSKMVNLINAHINLALSR